MKFLACLLATIAVAAVVVTDTPTVASSVKIIHSISLPKEINGIKIRELSALAYDPVEGVIWAVSDRGELHSFKVQYKANVPSGIRYVRSATLVTALQNAEGMDYLPASQPGKAGRLLIAFEEGPALISFTTEGHDPVRFNLPPPLDKPEAYAEENSRLESVAVDANGRFLTAPEEALQGRLDTQHTVFASDGETYKFPTFQPHRSNVKAIEFLDKQDKILVMERTRDEAGASTMRLRLVDLETCTGLENCDVIEQIPMKAASLAGNFEGLTRLNGDYFAAVTDVKHNEAASTKVIIFRIENHPSQ